MNLETGEIFVLAAVIALALAIIEWSQKPKKRKARRSNLRVAEKAIHEPKSEYERLGKLIRQELRGFLILERHKQFIVCEKSPRKYEPREVAFIRLAEKGAKSLKSNGDVFTLVYGTVPSARELREDFFNAINRYKSAK